MDTQTSDSKVADALESLRQEMASLNERVGTLEARLGGEGLQEELATVIAAAVAAYLGERPRIRQIRLVGDSSWREQGRATIQASHALRAGSG